MIKKINNAIAHLPEPDPALISKLDNEFNWGEVSSQKYVYNDAFENAWESIMETSFGKIWKEAKHPKEGLVIDRKTMLLLRPMAADFDFIIGQCDEGYFIAPVSSSIDHIKIFNEIVEYVV